MGNNLLSTLKQGMVIFTPYWTYGSRRKSPFLLHFWLTPPRRLCCSPTGWSCGWSAPRCRVSWMQVSLCRACWCFKPCWEERERLPCSSVPSHPTWMPLDGASVTVTFKAGEWLWMDILLSVYFKGMGDSELRSHLIYNNADGPKLSNH